MTDESEKKQRASKVIRLSPAVIGYLLLRRRKRESFDSILRRLFGLPTRRGDKQPLQNYYVIHNGGKPIAKLTRAEANGEAVLLAAKKGHLTTERVIRVAEVPS